jgi:putative hydrolase of the HAD superfamily
MALSNSATIKAVILDYGEVLCHAPTAADWSRMAGIFNIDPVLFRHLWGKNRLSYDRGDVSYEAYWEEIADETKTKLGPADFKVLSPWDVEMWARIDPTMVEWLERLHASGIKTGLLSNMPNDMIRYAREQFGWLKNFDHQTFSAEVRITKPDAGIYEHSLKGLAVNAWDALFVDDRAVNVEGAQKIGLRGIRFQSVAQLTDDLKKLEFPVLPLDSASSLTPAVSDPSS